MAVVIFLRGGGDLASGVALRLHRAGLKTVILELSQPLVVRRAVAFAEAVYQGETRVEDVSARLVEDLDGIRQAFAAGVIPVRVDPQAETLSQYRAAADPHTPLVLVDGRMTKQPPETAFPAADLLIGLGPGFTAGTDCHAVIETNRGHRMGRVIWQGGAEADTGVPESVARHTRERVLRAPADGSLQEFFRIGDVVQAGQVIAEVAGEPVRAPFDGVLRGLIHPRAPVWKGMKIGDLDPRSDPRFCFWVSDKSLAVGGAVLEAILSRTEFRPYLWS